MNSKKLTLPHCEVYQVVKKCVFVVKDNTLIIEKLSDGRYMIFVDNHPIVFTFLELKASPIREEKPWTWVTPPWSHPTNHGYQFKMELPEFKSFFNAFKKIFKEK